MPDDILKHFPTLHNLLPDRFAGTMWLGVALLVAIGLDQLKHLAVPYKTLGWALGALGLVTLFPITNYPAGASPLYSAYDTGLACPKTSGLSSGHPPVALLLPAGKRAEPALAAGVQVLLRDADRHRHDRYQPGRQGPLR